MYSIFYIADSEFNLGYLQGNSIREGPLDFVRRGGWKKNNFLYFSKEKYLRSYIISLKIIAFLFMNRQISDFFPEEES